MTMDKTYAEYQADVKRLGKFQGEQPYVPFYWEIYLEGCADEDDGIILKFYVSKEDKENFPELKNRKVVRLYQRDDGFICEC